MHEDLKPVYQGVQELQLSMQRHRVAFELEQTDLGELLGEITTALERAQELIDQDGEKIDSLTDHIDSLQAQIEDLQETS